MDSNALANQIKTTTYDKYPGIVLKDAGFTLDQLTTGATSAAQAITSVYKAKKLLTGSDNYSSYAIPSQTDFYSAMDDAYKAIQDEKELNEGTYHDDFMNYALFKATLAYLAKDNFAKFYSALKDTMKDGERAYVAYLTKYNTYAKFAAIDELDVSNTGTLTSVGKNPYRFDPTAANVFDMYGYAGQSSATGTISEEAKGDFDSY
ncbi:MAG: hypothetical protein MJ200_03970 [Mycoplasmoidaceae bacterium]|nr:hypothetical protein [Mycoplasmoidaceae bacterium]